jgi:ribosomal-protein-alanine N-acetyltransferase
MLPERIRTARLVLRPPRLADAEVIFHRYAQDADVTRYLTFTPHHQLSQTEAFIQGCIQAWASEARRPWVLTSAAGGDAAFGMLDLRLAGHRAEVGYVLARSAWGQGLMPEALHAVADLVLAEPGMFRLGAVCDVDNLASARVLEKVGMQREGILRRFIAHPNVSAEPRDVYSYAIVR